MYLIADLKAALPALPDKDRAFADSLIKSFNRYGLSEKQAKWVDTLVKRAKGEVPAPTAVDVGSFEGVVSLFALASQHLKRPKIRLQLNGAPIVLSVAGPASKAPGSINITDGRKFGENQWFGCISREGAWTQSNTQADGLTDLLKRLASEPAKVAAEYGKLTCQCCFCGRALEDERSTAVGYGPVCADNFGFPWGAANKTDLPGALPASGIGDRDVTGTPPRRTQAP